MSHCARLARTARVTTHQIRAITKKMTTRLSTGRMASTRSSQPTMPIPSITATVERWHAAGPKPSWLTTPRAVTIHAKGTSVDRARSRCGRLWRCVRRARGRPQSRQYSSTSARWRDSCSSPQRSIDTWSFVNRLPVWFGWSSFGTQTYTCMGHRSGSNKTEYPRCRAPRRTRSRDATPGHTSPGIGGLAGIGGSRTAHTQSPRPPTLASPTMVTSTGPQPGYASKEVSHMRFMLPVRGSKGVARDGQRPTA